MISYQLYSSRNFPTTADTLKMLAAAGYEGAEGFGGLYADKAGLADLAVRRHPALLHDRTRAAEFGADSRVCALPITDCKRRLTETLVCLREQSSRRVVATFLEMVRESLR